MANLITREHAEEVIAVHAILQDLHYRIYNSGNHDVADAVHRAARELEHPSVTGPLSQIGAPSGEIRP